MRLRLGKVTVADVLAAQPVTTNLLKFMRASINMIGVSNLQSFIASMTQKLTLSDISDESKNYLDKAGITTACLRIFFSSRRRHTRYWRDWSSDVCYSDLTPSFVSFFISYFVIAAFWAGHHRAFSLSRHWSPSLVKPNITMLAAVVFMPFATAYMALNMGQRVPTVLYDIVLLTTGLLNIRLVRLATSPPVVDESVDALTIARTRGRGWGVTTGAALALLFAFFVPRFSQFALMTIPIWLRLFVQRAEKRANQG